MIPEKLRCINMETGAVRLITPKITEGFTFKKDGWVVQEIEGGKPEVKPPAEKEKGAKAYKEAKIKAAKKLLENEKAGKPNIPKELSPESDTDEETGFYEELIAIKGIGKATADDIIRVYENKANLLEAIEKSMTSKAKKHKLPFTAGANKALLTYKTNQK